MKRRQFLKSVAALAGAAVLPVPAPVPLSEGLVFAAFSNGTTILGYEVVDVWRTKLEWVVGVNEDGTVATVDPSDLFLPEQPPPDVL